MAPRGKKSIWVLSQLSLETISFVCYKMFFDFSNPTTSTIQEYSKVLHFPTPSWGLGLKAWLAPTISLEVWKQMFLW